jgi:phosphoribosylaminoimidazole (AIR) synthetase
MWGLQLVSLKCRSFSTICSLAGKVDAFTPILQLKNNIDLLGEEQHEAFDLIKNYLSSASVLKALKVGVSFMLYIATEDKVIKAVLTQENEGKEHVVLKQGTLLL